ncbi:MAG: hypothetical protein F6K42_38720 [Leptolyngbya sp. SIO1D8]|nr:hypothetical protein [Leptolyngbya sp. SIO1D8]
MAIRLSTALLEMAAPYLDPRDPGRSAVGFCAAHPQSVSDITAAPPKGWEDWKFQQWDEWFGRINGVFLVDLQTLRVVQWPMYRTSRAHVPCDLSNVPGRLVPIEELVANDPGHARPTGPGVQALLDDFPGS